MNDPNQPPGTVRIQLDKNTVVYVKEGVDVEAVKEKFRNRNSNRGDYGYLMDFAKQTYYNKNGRGNY